MGKRVVGRNLSVYQKSVLMFTDAKEAFHQIKKEQGVYASLFAFFIALFIASFVRLLFQIFSDAQSEIVTLLPTVLAQQALVMFAYSLLIPFVLALVIHPFIIWFGGRGIANTFKIIAYSLIPVVLISLIPFVGHFSLILTLFFIAYGIHTVHDVTPFKSGLAVTLVFLIGYIAFLVVGLTIATTLGV